MGSFKVEERTAASSEKDGLGKKCHTPEKQRAEIGRAKTSQTRIYKLAAL
jgi:hypothetical protein